MSTIAAPNYRALESDGGVLVDMVGEHWPGDKNIRFGRDALLAGLVVDGERPRLIHTGWRSSAISCAFEVNNGVRIRDIDLECRTIAGQQNQVLGFGGTLAVSDAIAELVRVGLFGRTFALYCWGGTNNTIHAHRCHIEAGQYGVTAGGGSGPTAQFIYLYDCDVVIEFDRLRGAGGDQGLNSVGLWGQGGKVVMYGGSIRVKGSKDSPKARGAWLARPWAQPGEAWPYPWPFMELHNVTCRVTPNGSPDWCDVAGDIGAPIKIYGGTGSGANGRWITKGKVEVIDALREAA